MPGAAFIERLLINFPDLNARWLLTGVGEMTSEADVSFIQENLQANGNIATAKGIQSNNVSNNRIEKPIDKVVLLFSDGTFIDYNNKLR